MLPQVLQNTKNNIKICPFFCSYAQTAEKHSLVSKPVNDTNTCMEKTISCNLFFMCFKNNSKA